LGETSKGKSNDPSDLITTVAQFISLYGGIVTGDDFPLQCEQALRAGAMLRVARVVGAGALISTSGVILDNATTPNLLFHFSSKGEGVYYNNLLVEVKASSNGDTNYFDLLITDSNTGDVESYSNLTVTGFGTPGPYTYLKSITDASTLVNVEYEDLSSNPNTTSGTCWVIHLYGRS